MAKQENDCGCKPFKTSCGGQALIEGILMQGPEKRCIVVRKPDGGLDVTTTEVKPRKKIWRLPIIRGVVGFGSSMASGVRALMYSAEVAGDEETEEEPSKFEAWLSRHFSDEKVMNFIVTLSVLLGVGLSVGLFIVLPTLIGGGLNWLIPAMPLWLRSVVEGIVRVVLFMLYLWLCSRTKEMKRVFSYHGAEHKTIFCYEHGLDLTVENVRIQPRHHPRCGTSFLFVVIVVSILVSIVVFTPLHISNTWIRTLLHLALLPLIVGVTYEFNRYVGGHENRACRILRAPGLWMQNFTTFEPDDSMIEVGIAALSAVLPSEKGKDAWGNE